MAKELNSATVAAPGFFGLNTQEASTTLAAGFALEATNCVIDNYGRLGSRKGWSYLTKNNAGVDLLGGHDFIDIDGTHYHGAWSADSFYIVDGEDLTSVTYSGDNTYTTTPNWQAATLNDAAYLFDSNYKPVYFNPTTGVLDDVETATNSFSVSITSSGTTATVTHASHGFSTGQEVIISGCTQTEYNGTFTITVVDTTTYTYTLPNSTSSPATGSPLVSWYKGIPPHGNTVLSAYGRLWTAGVDATKTTVYWSDLLDGTEWSGGSAGSIDLASVLVKGNDEIVSLGAHNGRLIIFCKNNIVIYSDSDADQVLDPVNMRLVEVIEGVGCIARDSVANTGNDIVFLSETGLMSLGRVIQEKSQPLRELTKNVRDDLVRSVATENKDSIRALYSAREGFYLLYLPTYQQVYCVDMKSALQDGSARITTWDSQTFNNFGIIDSEVHFYTTDGVATYTGYTDNGVKYRLKYYTNHFDFGDSTKIKYLKRLAVTVIGGASQLVFFKAGFDFTNSYRSFQAYVDGGNTAEYGVSEFNSSAEYTTGVLADTIRTSIGGSGSVLQAGFETDINGAEFSIQRLDIYVKQGRTY